MAKRKEAAVHSNRVATPNPEAIRVQAIRDVIDYLDDKSGIGEDPDKAAAALGVPALVIELLCADVFSFEKLDALETWMREHNISREDIVGAEDEEV